MIKKHFALTAVFFISLWSLGACSYKNPSATVFIKSLSKQNPTDFIFDVSVAEVSAAMSQHQYDLLPGWSVEGKKDVIFDLSRVVLASPGNENDGYLCSESGGKSRLSEVYFAPAGKPCMYGADFHLHLTALNATRTKVEVFARRPWVYIGEQERAVGGYWHRRGIFLKVKPTTIEEYTILRNLGNALGTTNMPATVVPDEGSTVRQFDYREADTIDFARDGDLKDWSASF